MSGIQYTVRGVSERLDAELRREAGATGRSLNAVVVETLELAKLRTNEVHDDLDWFVGSASRDSAREQEEAQDWLDAAPAELT